MSRYLIEAGDLIRAGEYRKALRRLDRARHAALGRKDLEELGQILTLARTACERGGIPTGTGDVIYAIEQNIRYLERRLGIEGPSLADVPVEHTSSTQPPPAAQASDDEEPAPYAGLQARGPSSRDVIIRRRRIVDLICLGLLVLTGALHGWALFGIVLIVWPIIAFSRLFRRPEAAVTGPRVEPTRLFAPTGVDWARDEDEPARGEEARSLGAVPIAALAGRLSVLLGILQSRFAALAADVAETRPDELGLIPRLEWLEEELRSVGRLLVALRREAEAQERAAAAAQEEAIQEPEPVVETIEQPEPVRAEPPPPVPEAPPIPKVTLKDRLEGLYARLESMGAKAFALVGGVVLLLGVALLLVFAAPRVFGGGDWFGPEARLGFAGFASAIVLLLGLRIRARYGNLYAASAAVGVGLAGWYGTILVSAALYDFLPALGALAAAVAVAAVGGAIALWWSSELVAGLALVGAMILPGVSLAEGNRSLLGAAFVLVLAAGTGLVGVFRRWSFVLVSGVVVSAAQMVVLVADSGPSEPGHWQRLALTGGFWCVYAASGVAFQVRDSSSALRQETAAVLLPGAALASWTAEHLLAGEARGAALLPLAVAYAILGGGVLARSRQRDLGALLGGLGAAVAVFGFAALLTGTPLVVAWAAQVPLLAWIARQTNEPRFRLAAAAYLGLALGRLVVVDSPPNRLFEAFHHPGLSAPGSLVVLVAAALLAWFLPAAVDGESALDKLTAWLRIGALWLAGLLGLYALSLTVLELAQLGGAGLQENFHRGHVALAIVWSTLAAAGVATRRARLEQAGLILLALTVVEVLAFDVRELSQREYALSMLAAAAGSLGAALWTRRLSDGAALALLSAGLATVSVVQLFAGDGQGYAFLVEGSVYAVAAAVLFAQKRRDLASLLGALSLGLGTAGCAELLSGISLVATGAAAAGLLALIAGRFGEERLLAGAGAALGLSFVYALVHEAPPRDLFVAVHHPGLGAASIALCVPAAVLIARAFPVRSAAVWPAGLLGLYALSLTVLELAQLGGGGLQENFHRGHLALAIVWSSLAAAGVATRRQQLEWAGLGLLSLTVVEVLAFDVRELSQHQASASLLAAAAASLVASLLVRRELPESLLLALIAVGLATGALALLFTGDALAYSLLGEGAVYAGVTVFAYRRRRDLASLLGVLSLGLGAAACVELISGVSLVAAGAGASALLALLGRRAAERRLAGAAAGVLALSLGYALVHEAPPSDLFVATRHPGVGAASLALCVLAAAVLVHAVRLQRPRGWIGSLWAIGALGLYALSLTVLELAQALGGARLQENFHHGHVALAIFWSALAVTIVGAAQRLRSTAIELAGAGVLGLALVVALGFDTHELSRREYALAFLAVGAAALTISYLWQRARPQGLSPEAVLGIVASAGLVTAAVVVLLASGDARAFALLGEAAVYGAFAWLSLAGRLRDFGSLLGVLALTLGAAACAGLVSGLALVAAGAGAAALLALLAKYEERLVAGSGALVTASLGYALVHEAPPSDLFVATRHPGVGAASIALCAVAVMLLARGARLRTAASWAAAVLGLYVLSLTVLELAQALGGAGLQENFQYGHVALAIFWSALAVTIVGAAQRLRSTSIELAGVGVQVLALVVALGFDAHELSRREYALAFLAVGVGALTISYLWQRARPQGLSPEAVLGIVASAALGTAGVVLLASGDDRAFALLGEAAVYGAFAWLSLAGRLRDFGSLLGTLALGLGVAGCSGLISGVSLVAAGAGAAAVLGLLSRRAGEQRLAVGGAGVLALSLGYALVHEPPSALFVATRHPGVGAASVALCVLAAAVLAYAARLQSWPGWTASLWAVGAFGLYALSLTVLELAQAIGTGTVHSRFQSGEAAVSGTWAAVALVFLYLGLRLQTRAFQAVGFALFGVSLGKIFLFDLPSLTALTRALSFIAVGALLLTAGFFYQRLIQQAEGGSDEARPGVG